MFENPDFVKAIRMESPEKIPVTAGFLPAMWIHHGKEAERLVKEYPQFFGKGDAVDYSDPFAIANGTYKLGEHVDEWGCVWSNVNEGMEAIVTGHPVKTPEDVRKLQIPSNRDGRIPHGFMYLRLLDLCGFENAMMMFAEEEEELQILIDKVVEYNKYQIEAVAHTWDKVVYFGDDQGMQKGLAIGPERWRKYMKPAFKELYSYAKKLRPDVLIYMHTDGCIHEIMQDLMECGVDMLNPQYRANGLDNLVRVCRQEQMIPITLDLDRQLFPFATPSQIDDHVRECVESLYSSKGGLALLAELNYDIPIDNCAAILEAMEKYRHYKRR